MSLRDASDLNEAGELQRDLGQGAIAFAAYRDPTRHDAEGTPASRDFIVRSQHELLEASKVPADWVIEGLAARKQVALVAGSPKDGKSTFLVAAMSAVSHGRPSFAGFKLTGKPVGILYLHEDPPGTVGRRIQLASVGANFGAVAHRENLRLLPPEFAPQHLADAVARAAEKTCAGIVFIDTLRRWVRLDERDEMQADDAIACLQAVAHEHDLAIVVVHHTRKPAVGKGGSRAVSIDEVRGSNALTGAPDSVLLVRRKPEGSSYVNLQGWGREAEHDFTRRLHYDVATARYDVVQDEKCRREADRSDALVAAVEAVFDETGKPVSRTKAVDRCRSEGVSCPNDGASGLLARLVDDKRLRRHGTGYLPIGVDLSGGDA